MEMISVVKRNIIANTIGGLWVLALGLFLVPAQFKILGSEIVGLLGFVATLQLIFSIFDFGLAPTILREVASDSSPERVISHQLIQSVSIIYWSIAAILSMILTLSASWLVENWVTLDTLTKHYAIFTIQLLALRLFVAWPLKIYVNILAGFQRLDIVNTLRVLTQTTSIIGGIIILLVWRELHIFIWWTIIISLLSLILHIIACYRFCPGISLVPKFSMDAVKRVWRFSLDMNILTAQGILLTQVDNMMVSYLMPLKMLGYYTGAYSINQKSIQTFSNFLSDAMLPTLSEDFGHGRITWLRLRFQKYSQLVNYVAMVPTCIFIFWGYDVLRIWTTLEVANEAYTTLAILSLGFMFHAMMIPYLILCIATKNTYIPRNANWAGVCIYLTSCYLLILQWGINGAALAWLLFNIYYQFTILPFTHIKVLDAHPFIWVTKNFLPFILIAIVCFGAGRAILEIQTFDNEFVIWGICSLSTACYGLLSFFFLEDILQKDIRQMVMRTIYIILGLLKIRGKAEV